jgi:Shedu protein SduA, C-terminal
MVLDDIHFGARRAEQELGEFKLFLEQNDFFSETQVVKLLRDKPHLSCLIGTLTLGLVPTQYKFEFHILGAFKADLVVGNIDQKDFVFVEFEGGEERSIFSSRRTNQMRDWSQQMGHGFGQLVDWAWAINGNQHSDLFKNALGCDGWSAAFLLVCGRESNLNDTELKRVLWRGKNVLLQGQHATFLTYDGLRTFLQGNIEAIKTYAAG